MLVVRKVDSSYRLSWAAMSSDASKVALTDARKVCRLDGWRAFLKVETMVGESVTLLAVSKASSLVGL